jgi:hypothetical protein
VTIGASLAGASFEGSAACEWSFNWYCSGCAKIGARTTGTNGGFADRQSCEAARANMQSTMNSRGGGVNTVACQSSGACSAPPAQGGAPRSPGTGTDSGYGPAPSDYDPGAEQRQREEARRREEQLQREQQARIERERDERVRRDREDALNQMKGASAASPASIKSGPPGDLGLKGLPSQPAAPSGKFTAWHQLHCVAGLLDRAIAEIDKPAPDPAVVHATAQQLGAAQIWDGTQPLCARAPDPPAPYGEKSLSGASMVRFYGNVTRAAARDADLVDRTLQARFDDKTAKAALGYLPQSAQLSERLRKKTAPSSRIDPGLMEEEVLFADLEPNAARPSPGVWTRLVAAVSGYLSPDELRRRVVAPPEGLARHRSDLIPGTPAAVSADDSWQRLRNKRANAEQAARERYLQRLTDEIVRINATQPGLRDEDYGRMVAKVHREMDDAFVAAMKTATAEMKQAIASLQARGTLAPGDDVRRRMAESAEVRRAVLSAQAIVVAKEQAAFRAARELMVDKLEKWDAANRRRNEQVGAAAQRLDREERAEVERQWQGFFAELVTDTRNATAALKRHRQSIAQVLADPAQAGPLAARVK